MFNSSWKKIKPDYVAVAFDKAARPLGLRNMQNTRGLVKKDSDELKSQFGIVRNPSGLLWNKALNPR